MSEGTHISGRFVRAVYLSGRREAGSLQIGITIPKKSGGAVERNRLKRLLREAIRKGIPALQRAIDNCGKSLEIIFQLRVTDMTSFRKGFLHHLESDIQFICNMLQVRMSGGK